MLNKLKGQEIGKMTVIYSLLAAWLIISVFPFIWTILTSVKHPVDAFAMPPEWTFEPTFNSFRALWIDGQFISYLKNTIVITGGSVIISLAIGLPAGYAIARYSKSGSFILLLLALSFRAFPRTLFIIPFYHIARLTGLYDTRFLLIMVMVSINQPFTIWMLRSFFMSIPESLEEAAMIDGCTRLQAFIKVIIPIMGPGVITAGIFTFMLAYNEYFIPVVLTATKSSPLTVAIAQFGVDSIREWPIAAAGATSISLPVIILVLLAQKYIVEGLAAGAVKE